MTPERWSQLEPLVDAALDLPGEQRRAYVDSIITADPVAGAELAHLIALWDGDDLVLDRAAAERSALLSAAAGFPTTPATDVMANLQASLGAEYRLEGELGGGGMSRLFIASQVGLDRRVVIKVLPPELAAGISSERFEREIKLAASLQQANIVPLLAAGNAGGLPYYTMPLAEGRSLRERLERDGPLPIAEAMSVLRDIARALAYAHERGVVHRDIKPGNVLLSGGAAVVTDFGIAKALGAARTKSPTVDASTHAGVGIGTPAYMAPEQAVGDPSTDRRADIYAFGCVAYELLTGVRPFHGHTPHEIVAAHLQKRPPSTAKLRPDVPPAIDALIMRCLEKNPARRPQSAAELLHAIDAAAGEPIRSRRRAPAIAAGAIVLVGALVAIAAYIAHRNQSMRDAAEPVTFAVVPFENVARDTALDYRADGIGDEILTAMGKVSGVQIVGRNAAYRFKGKRGVDVRVMERELGARFLVTGTWQEMGGRLRVAAQLNDSSSPGELWATNFDRDPSQLRALSDSIAAAIIKALRSRLGNRFAPTAPRDTTNVPAFDAFMEGQELFKRRGAGVAKSVEQFEHAIALDSTFARAHAALATALELYPFFTGISARAIRDRAADAAHRAVELDSTLADAHTALGYVYANDGRWNEAAVECQTALRWEPDNAAALLAYGRLLMFTGREAEALAQLQHARKIERGSALMSAWVSYAFFLNGQVDSALSESARAAQLDSTLAATANFGALINVAESNGGAARRLVASLQSVNVVSNAPYVYAKSGDTATAWRLVQAMETANPPPWFTEAARASVMLAIRDTTRALNILEKSANAMGPLWTVYLPVRDPAYDAVRRSARFAKLLEGAGLEPRLITAPRPGRSR